MDTAKFVLYNLLILPLKIVSNSVKIIKFCNQISVSARLDWVLAMESVSIVEL